MKYVKGFHWGRKTKYKAAKEALLHAWTYAFRDRKAKKRDFREFWQTRINVACRQLGLTYGQFIHGLREKKIELDRKVLAELAQKHPDIFKEIVKNVKG